MPSWVDTDWCDKDALWFLEKEEGFDILGSRAFVNINANPFGYTPNRVLGMY